MPQAQSVSHPGEVMLGITVFDEGLSRAAKEKIVRNMMHKEGSEDHAKKGLIFSSLMWQKWILLI